MNRFTDSIILLLALLIYSCSSGKVAGTTDETELELSIGVAGVLVEGRDAVPVEGATVSLMSSAENSATPIREVFSDSAGGYHFDSLVEGTYQISAQYIDSEETLAVIIPDIAVYEYLNLGTDTLWKSGSVSGVIRFAEDSLPVSALIVYVPGTSWMAITDSEGTFLLSGIAPGVHELSFLGGIVEDTIVKPIQVISGETTPLNRLYLNKKQEVIYRDVYGVFTEHYETVSSVAVEIITHSDSVGVVYPLDWNRLSNGFSGYIPLPKNEDAWLLRVIVKDSQKRIIGIKEHTVSQGTGDILIPNFDPWNARPTIDIDTVQIVAKGDTVTFSYSATDSFGGSCVWYGIDFESDGIVDDSATLLREFFTLYDSVGTYTATVTVRDNEGNTTSKKVTVKVPDTLPEIAWISPVADTVIWDTTASLTLLLEASDIFGSISEQKLDIDGDGIFETAWKNGVPITVPFTYGKHLISAMVTDSEGNTVVDSIEVRLEYIHEVSVGGNSTVLRTYDNRIFAAGSNINGKLGIGSQFRPELFELVMEEAVAVETGKWHNAFIDKNNVLFMTGSNGSGQLGIGSSGSSVYEPVQVMNDVAQVALGEKFSLMVTHNSELYGCGVNYTYGQFGVDSISGSDYPILLREGVIAVSAGLSHSLILDYEGTLWGAGDNSSGQIGNGESGYKLKEPLFTKILTDIRSIEAGYSFSLAIDSENRLWGFGNNQYGQLGNGKSGNGILESTPIQITDNVEMVSAGNGFTMILKRDGTLWACGNNLYGQLGTGDSQSRSIPVLVAGSVVSVSAGESHSSWVTSEGKLFAVGSNELNQFGDESVDTISVTPVQIFTDLQR